MVYLDYNATTPVDKRVIEKMTPYFQESFGNPSSPHQKGQIAKFAIENARKLTAEFIDAQPQEIYFTSCGSESNNLAIRGYALANSNRGRHIIVSPIEHKSVLRAVHSLKEDGFVLDYLPVDSSGLIDPSALRKNIRPDTILVSCMWANNEIGTIEPVKELADICKEYGVVFHTDAVQAAGKLNISVKETPVDLLSISAHKFYGPKGTGALFIREGLSIRPIIYGGNQEGGLRSGTQNVAGIVGLAEAAKIAKLELDAWIKEMERLKTKIEDTLLSPEFPGNPEIIGARAPRLPNTTTIYFKDMKTVDLMIALDIEGICVSTGSACQVESEGSSSVVDAIGLNEASENGILRISLGKYSQEEEIDIFLDSFKKIISKYTSV